MQLFFIDRLKALPPLLRETILFNIIAGATIAVEGVIIMIIQVKVIPHWVIPLIAVGFMLVKLLIDYASKFDLTVLHKVARVTHVVSLIGWVLLLTMDWSWFWVLTCIWIFDTVVWGAESIKVSSAIATSHTDTFEEYRRIEIHNKVLPKAGAMLLGAGALAVGTNFGIVLVLVMNVLMMIKFITYQNLWKEV